MRDDRPDAGVISRDDPVSAEIVGDAEDAAAIVPADKQSQTAARRPPDYRGKQSAVGGAVGSIVLGVIGLAGSFFSAASLFVSLTGLALGLWGLFSEKKWLAAVGLFICVVAVLIGGYQAVTWLYQNFERQENEAPFEFEPIEEESRTDKDGHRVTCVSYTWQLSA